MGYCEVHGKMTREQAKRNLASYLGTYYKLTLDEVETIDTPGYWRIKKPCGGVGQCKNLIHSCVGNEGPMQHTIQYRDSRRENGRFVSPYRTWWALYEA